MTPRLVPMPPATIVPMTPTISETRAPCSRRLNMSRPWKSVPSRAAGLAPSTQNGGSKILAPGIGSVGSYGAMIPAKPATRKNGIRIASGRTGSCSAKRSQRRLRPARAGALPAKSERVCSETNAMKHLSGEANAGVDIGVQDVDHQIDQHDHHAGQHHDSLHEGEIALEDALVEQPA